MVATAEAQIDQLLTGEEFSSRHDLGRSELISGRILELPPPQPDHGYFELEIGAELRAFVKKRAVGWVTVGDVGLYTRRNPDTIRGADVLFISNSRCAERPTKYLSVAPELIVEVLSPDDRWHDVQEKVAEYLAVGVDVIWVLDPKSQTVQIYRSKGGSARLTTADTLEGEGLLTGFSLPLASLFAG